MKKGLEAVGVGIVSTLMITVLVYLFFNVIIMGLIAFVKWDSDMMMQALTFNYGETLAALRVYIAIGLVVGTYMALDFIFDWH